MKLISVDEISSLYKKCNADECYIPKDTIRNTLNTGTLGNSLNQGKMLHGDINFNFLIKYAKIDYYVLNSN